MRKNIPPLLWTGLVINILLTAALWLGTLGSDEYYHLLNYDDRRLFDVLNIIKVIFVGCVIVQIISLLLINKMGKLLAAISSVIMFPLGIFFILGYHQAFNAVIYRSLTQYYRDEKSPLDIDLLFNQNKYIITGSIMFSVGLIIIFLSKVTPTLGLLLLALSFVQFIYGFKNKQRTMIGLKGNNLIITPMPIANTYQIPCQQVKLLADGKNNFTLLLHTDTGEHKVRLNKKEIDSTDSQSQLDAIFLKLAKSTLA